MLTVVGKRVKTRSGTLGRSTLLGNTSRYVVTFENGRDGVFGRKIAKNGRLLRKAGVHDEISRRVWKMCNWTRKCVRGCRGVENVYI
jgi:hypothetical protein